MNEPIGIAGAGRIASALGRLLQDHGGNVVAVASRRPESAREAACFIGGGCAPVPYAHLPRTARRLVVAVSDDSLGLVAGLLAAEAGPDMVVLHTSGRFGAEALEVIAAHGAACGSLHHLQTVANGAQGVRSLPGSAFALDGAAEARAWALEIVGLLSGTPLEIPAARRALYHAAAVMASNCLVGAIDAAVSLMEKAGVDSSVSLRALGPLARTSLDNALTLGPAAALTGPVERGDLRTLTGHIRALEQAPPTVRGLYLAAARHLVDLAGRRNPDRNYEAIERLLENENG